MKILPLLFNPVSRVY